MPDTPLTPLAELVVQTVADEIQAGLVGFSAADARAAVLLYTSVPEIERILSDRFKTRAALENVAQRLGERVRDGQLSAAGARVELEAWTDAAGMAAFNETVVRVAQRMRAGIEAEPTR